MTNYTNARDALITFFSTAWAAQYPTVPVFYENQDTIDLNAVGDQFLKVELNFNDAEQADLGDNPLIRVDGQLVITIMAKVGTGTRGGLIYADYLTTLFKFQNLSSVQVHTPTLGHKEVQAGWYYQDLIIPFHFHMT